jgi:uncharacterized RDD family membrane protein YckC
MDTVLILVMTLFTLFAWSAIANETPDLNQLVSLPVLSGAGAAYFLLAVILESRLQGTPGLKLMDCCLLDLQTGGSISLAQSLVRNLAWPLSVLPLMLGVFWIIFDRHGQTFHDKLAGTVVVIDDAARLTLDELSGRP